MICYSVHRVGNGAPGQTFTQIVGGTINKKPNTSIGVKKILDRKLRNGTHNSRPILRDFKVYACVCMCVVLIVYVIYRSLLTHSLKLGFIISCLSLVCR